MPETAESTGLRLLLVASRFAVEHPYAATFLAGAGFGSFATYKYLTYEPQVKVKSDVFPAKVYEVEVTREALQEMLNDPTAELRWDLPKMTFVVVSQKRERRPELPDIEYTSDSSE